MASASGNHCDDFVGYINLSVFCLHFNGHTGSSFRCIELSLFYYMYPIMKRKDTDSGLQRGNVIGFTCQVIFLESKGNNSCKRFLAVVNYLKYCITKASETLCLKRCFAQLGGKQMARKCFITGKKQKPETTVLTQ